MTHPVPQTAIASTLSALLAHPGLDDCAVTVRQRPDGGAETVAYVVRRFAVADDELRAHLVAGGASGAITLVSVAAIPYLPDGRPDLGALSAQPLADVAVATAWEGLVRRVAGVSHVAALVREPRAVERPLHVDDLLAPELRPGRRRAETAAREQPAAGAPPAVVAGGRPAIADGGPLPPDDASGPAVLSDVLCRTAIGGRRARRGLTYVAADGSERYQSYGDLLGYAEQLLAGLRAMGLAPGDRVLLLLPQHRDFLPAFWACVLGGFVPVPLAAPARYDQPSPALEAVRGAWRVTRPAAVLASGAAAAAGALVPAGDRCQVRGIESLRGGAGAPHHRAGPDDVALLMMTSGSTGTPKAVALTHRNLLARTRASQIVNAFTDADVSLNWMPLDHVAGLIYFHLRDVYLGCHQVHLPTPAVVQDPCTWLDALDRYRATVTFAPNFAYGLLLDRERELASRRWDLSSVRYVLNGAEAIVARTARRFLTALAPHGLRPTAMRPAWGMSETSSGVTYSDGFTLDTTADDQPFVEVGAPIPSVAMRVVDEHDVVVDEGVVGRLQISGATVMHGYFDAPDQTREAFTADGWFKTGDLAVIRGGRITVTGREKDVIIVNSVNYYSHAIESVVDTIDGVEPSFTAAVAVRRGTDTDSLAIFFVPGSADPATLAGLLPRIRAEVARAIGVTAEYLVPVAPADVPKTSLGKIQRTELARELIAGAFDDRLKIVAALLGTDDVVPAWFFRRVWRAKALVPGDGSLDGRRVVLFDPGGPYGESLRRELAARGAAVVSVAAGDAYARLGADRFVVAPARSHDYAALVGALVADGPIEHLVHAWSTAPPDAADDELLATGAVSVLLLIQAVASTFAGTVETRSHAPGVVTLTCVTTHTHRVMTGDEIAPARSALAAIVASAPQELEWLRARHVDVSSHDAAVAARLAADEHAAAGSDRDAAYRDGRRFVWGLERASLGAASWHDIPLIRGGCYLVTGGAGGVAEHVVTLLRETVDARVLLIGRRPLERAASRALLRRVGDGDVAYAVADVCDEEALSNAVAAHEAQCGRRLDGVVHLAGSYHEAAIETETADALLATIRPKLAGTINLHRLLAARGGGVLVAGSSVAGIFGGANIASYAAASACQSAFAQQHAGRGVVQQYCMAWSTWDDTGLSRGYRSDLPRSRGYLPMSPARARVSLLAGLAAGQGTLVVGLDGAHRGVRRYLGASMPELVELFHDGAEPAAVEQAMAAAEIRDRFGLRSTAIATCLPHLPLLPSGEVDRAQLAATGGKAAPRPRQAPRTDAERALAEVWRRVLNASEIDVDDNFFDHGGDSLTALRLTGALRETLGVELPPRVVFEASTFAELARAIEAARPAAQPAATVAPAAVAPLSEGQRALWLLHALAPASAALNVGFTARLRGRVDFVALARAWQALVERHPTLRTVFPVEDGAPVRRVLTSAAVPCAVENASGWSDDDVLAAIAAEIDRPFDLAAGPVVRVRLWQRAEGDAFLAATFHHIAIDGGSLWLCLSELGDLYDRACRGALAAVDEDSGFERYLQRQARLTGGADRARHLEFWRAHLDGRGQPASFAPDRPRPAQPRYAGASHRFGLGARLSGRLRQLAREHRCTVQMVVFALFETLLARHTGQDDVTVGYLSSGRSAAELDGVVGYLANPLPLRARVPANLPFATLLQQTRDAVLEAMTHDELPFPLVAQALEPQREPGRSPLFQVLFVYEKPTVLADQHAGAFALGHPGASMKLGTLALESLPFAAQREGQYDVTLVLGDVGDELEVSFDYRTELYDVATIERLGRQLTTLAESASARAETPLAELALLDDAELVAIRAINDTTGPRPATAPATTFHALVAAHAAARPESPALAFEGAYLSYAELEARAGRLAAALVSHGLTPGAIVGLCAERSFDLVVGALAILKAGAAFLPLDPAYPPERLAFMLDDSEAPFVVTHRGLGDRLGSYAGGIIDIEGAGSPSTSAPVVHVTERDLAYVIYTSGSTGRPKGVLLEHHGLVNVALEQQRLFGAGPGSRVLQFASISFDAAVFDLAMALGSGATLHLAPPEAILPGAPLLRTLREQAITIVTLPPSALIATPDAELPALEVITVAGEACPAELVDRWAPGRRFFNLYGPTEATIWATAVRCTSGGGTPSIGRPIANTEAYVLDGRGALAPIGVAGELHLGGAGLARAYHRRDDLTRASFVPNPFGPAGARLYKTGDRARLRANGELEFLGRLDAQVKVRGYRIELGEIDARLAELTGVEQAVTVVGGGLDAARLLAYVTPRAGASLTGHALRAALRARLPEFMVPSVVTVLDALPLTPSGKIDRARLPAAGEPAATAETFVAPTPGLEAAIADIWKDVLGVSRVGVTDNFFDLGGTSLLIARVHARLETLAPGAFSLVDLFGLPTVQMLAARLAGAGSEAVDATDRRDALAAGRARLAAAAGRRAAAREGRGPRP